MEKENIKKSIKNLILFFLLIFITFYIIFRDQSIDEIIKIVKNVDLKFVFIAIICMFLYFCSEALNVTRTMKKLGEKVSFWRNLRYTLIRFFL